MGGLYGLNWAISFKQLLNCKNRRGDYEYIWFLDSNTVVFESNFLRVSLAFLLFGSCIQFLNSNPFTVQMILKSAKMKTTKKCFHFLYSVLNIII